MGGSCDADSREKFSDFFREAVSGKLEDYPVPAAVGKWESPMDEKGLVYDYFYQVLCNCIIYFCFHTAFWSKDRLVLRGYINDLKLISYTV